MKTNSFPIAATPNHLLVDFVSRPVSMRSDRHIALLRDLALGGIPLRAAGKSPEQIAFERRAQEGDDPEDGSDPTEYIAPWEEPIYSVVNGVAIVEVFGPLLKGYDAFTCWCYGYFCLDRLQAAVTEIAQRTDVAVVVFNFNSPGGVVTGIPEAAAQIAALGAQKLTVAFTDTICCSAAYWLGSQCSAFHCTVSADVGSIGTYMALYDYSAMLKQWGVSLELFKRGKYKAIGVMGSTLTKEQRAFLDADVGRTNDRFLAAVRNSRGTVGDETMQGQWFDGEQAVALNLADSLVTGLPALLDSLSTGLASAMAAAV